MPRPGRPPECDAVTLPAYDAMARIIEACEGATCTSDHDEIDGLFAEAMRKIASARSANRELQRRKLGLVTIAETG